MPSPLDRWTRLWSSLFGRRLDREVMDELDFHLDMRTREYRAEGLSPEAARRRAEERFGDVGRMRREAIKAERTRIQKRERALYMDELRQDLRFGLRQLWKRPGFSLIALTMLALGIGANTAIFSVVQTVLLKPLPFHEPHRILRLWESRLDQGWERASFAPGNFWDMRDMNQAFEELGAFGWTQVNLTGFEHPERLRAGQVTAGFFGRVLGVSPMLGRTLLQGEDEPGGDNHVALLAEDFWRQRFGGDPAIVGSTLTLDDEVYTVVGVLPRGSPWLDYADVFTPLVRDPEATRGSFELAALGRLKPGIPAEAGLADLERVARRLAELYPDIDGGMGVTVGTTDEWVASQELRRALWVLLAAVGFLLLIASVNLANLLLAKATGRVQETAIRAAVGAGRGRLLRQAFTESVLLSVLGGGFGVLLALWGLDLIRAMDPGSIPRLGEVTVNGWVLLLTLAIAVLTGILAGVAPAFQSSGSTAAATLKSGARSISGGRGQRRLRGALVSVETALSLTLLIGAGLLIRSFTELLSVDRGFRTENLLVASVSLSPDYGGGETEAFLRQFTDRARHLPQVVEIAAVSSRPLSGASTGLGIVTPENQEPEGGIPWAQWRLVTPTYLEAMGFSLLKGRFFDDRDVLDPLNPVNVPIVVSQRLADLLWKGEDPIGKTAMLWAGQDDLPGQVVGVVEDIRERGLDADPTLAVYLPYYGVSSSPDFVIHTIGEPTAAVPALREILGELDPNLPLSDIATMDEIVGTSLAERRFLLTLVGVFASMALLLALAGVYGVQSFSVSRQTSEIGIRVAIGAEGRRIVRSIVLQAMGPATLGIVLGLGGAFALSRLMQSLLFQVAATDPLTYLSVAGVLAGTALVSCWLPARRAARIDPVIAFRSE